MLFVYLWRLDGTASLLWGCLIEEGEHCLPVAVCWNSATLRVVPPLRRTSWISGSRREFLFQAEESCTAEHLHGLQTAPWIGKPDCVKYRFQLIQLLPQRANVICIAWRKRLRCLVCARKRTAAEATAVWSLGVWLFLGGTTWLCWSVGVSLTWFWLELCGINTYNSNDKKDKI